jgi:hypothetical protein
MTTTTYTAAATEVTEIVLPGLIEASGLQIRHQTLPAPAAGQVLVQVEASGGSAHSLSAAPWTFTNDVQRANENQTDL